MSYFNSDDQSSGSNLEKLIAEKGEQWKDPEAIAKGYLSAQDHIKSLERKNSELLEDLTKAKTREEVLEEMRNQSAQPTSREPVTQESAGATGEATPSLGAEDIKKLVAETLTSQEREKTASQNLRDADAKLTEKYGTEVSKVVDARAKELGLSAERMREIASESPSAFLALIGEPEPVQSNPVPRSEVNTQSDQFTQTSGKRDWNYYQDMRRKNPQLYYSAKIQQQLDDDYVAGHVVLPQ